MPDLDSKSLYKALLAKDSRFDGRFFVGVATTGVYCRPVCRARKPLAVNCSFYATAAEAEQAGFRPCLLCRPELAPGYAPVDSSASLARAAARYIEKNCGVEGSLTDIARHLGCSNRHLPDGHRPSSGMLQPSPAPCLRGRLSRASRRVPPDLQTSTGQEPSDRHEPICGGRGLFRGIRQPAPLQRGVPTSLPADAHRFAQPSTAQ